MASPSSITDAKSTNVAVSSGPSRSITTSNPSLITACEINFLLNLPFSNWVSTPRIDYFYITYVSGNDKLLREDLKNVPSAPRRIEVQEATSIQENGGLDLLHDSAWPQEGSSTIVPASSIGIEVIWPSSSKCMGLEKR